MKIQARVTMGYALIAACAGFAGITSALATGCSSDNGTQTLPTQPASNSDDAGNGGTATGTHDSGSTTTTSHDAGTPTSTDDGGDGGVPTTADAGVDSGPPPGFCASQTGLAFCSDFDESDSLVAGGAGWDTVANGNNDTNLTIATDRAVSAPSSLSAIETSAGKGDSKVVKMVAGTIHQATYDFDLYVDHMPMPGGGGFLTDWQFSDTNGDGTPGADTFGFRISIFSKDDGTLDHSNIEHNLPAVPNGGGDDWNNPIPLKIGAWTHVKMVAAYSTANATNSVSFQLYLDNAALPTLDKTYAAPFATAPFVRIAEGMVAPFNDSRDWAFHFDNVTLKVQ